MEPALFFSLVTGQLCQCIYWLIHHPSTSEMPTLLYNTFLYVLISVPEIVLPYFSDCSFANNKLF